MIRHCRQHCLQHVSLRAEVADAIADSAAAAGKDLFSPRANTNFVNALNEGLSNDDDEAFSNALRRGR